jgi:Ribonuclease G/E
VNKYTAAARRAYSTAALRYRDCDRPLRVEVRREGPLLRRPAHRPAWPEWLHRVEADAADLPHQVRSALNETLKHDPALPQILGWTRLGHLELVRPHRGRPPAEAMIEPRSSGPLVKIEVAVAHGALHALRREARTQPGRHWSLTVNPDVAAALADGVKAALRALEQRFGNAIVIEADPGLDRVRFQIAPV